MPDEPRFSDELLDKLMEEADALGVKGATPITVLLRGQLTERKKHGRGVTDERHRAYWLAARIVDRGVSDAIRETKGVTGLAAIAEAVDMLQAFVGREPLTLEEIAQVIADQTPSQRVQLTRTGRAHFSVILEARDEAPVSWIDVWAFHSITDAEAFAKEIPAGKVF